MSDFDFDELDKAVNSALGQQPNDTTDEADSGSVAPTEPTVSTEDSNTLSRQPTAAVSLHNRTMASSRISRHETPETEAPASLQPDTNTSTESVTTETPEDTTITDTGSRTRLSLPTRRSGRFMDVVHPSSDMRSRTASAPTSRIGTTVPAAEQSETTTPKPNAPVVDSFTNTSSTAADTAIVTAPGLPANKSLESAINDLLISEGHAPVPVDSVDTPDVAPVGTEPVETSAPEPETEAPQTLPPKPASTETPTEDLLEDFDGLKFEEILNDKASETPAPQTSPFIEGAKVDKRPLGGVDLGEAAPSETPAPVVAAQENSEIPETSSPSEELERPTDVSAEEVLPEELNDTVVAIEAASAEDGAAPASLEIETDAPEESAAPSTDGDKRDTNTSMTRGAYEGPTSIAKQYKEEPRHDDDDSGDIFDTKTYHQPIKNDEKSRSMIPWIIAIVVLVILVAGGVFFAWWSGILPSM